MKTCLDIALLLIGTTATLAAFGGKTWQDGPRPLFQRITPRGWLSLFCWIIALSLGVAKEVWTLKQDWVKDKQDAVKEMAAKLQLQRTEADLERIKERAELTQARLSDANNALGDLRRTLAYTSKDLDEQSAAGMITALVNAHQNVRDMQFVIPLTAKANREWNIRGDLLPEFDVATCDNWTDLEVSFSIGNQTNSLEHISYGPGDYSKGHKYYRESIPKKDDLITPLTPGSQAAVAELQALLHQSSTNKLLYFADLHTLGHSVSLAQLYSVLSRPGSEIFGIVPHWTQSEPIPAACSKQLRQYFAAAFEKAALILVPEDPSGEMIIFKLKAKIASADDGQWFVVFSSYAQPVVKAADPSSMLASMSSWLDYEGVPKMQPTADSGTHDPAAPWSNAADVQPSRPDKWVESTAPIVFTETVKTISALLHPVEWSGVLSKVIESTSVGFSGCDATVSKNTITDFGDNKLHETIKATVSLSDMKTNDISVEPNSVSGYHLRVGLATPIIARDIAENKRFHVDSLDLGTFSEEAQADRAAQAWYMAIVYCGGAPLTTTWTDKQTNLVWVRADNGQAVSWREAVEYCRNLIVGGRRDWRLPSIDELEKMYGETNQSNTNGHIRLTYPYILWSSTFTDSSGRIGYVFPVRVGHRSAQLPDFKGAALCAH